MQTEIFDDKYFLCEFHPEQCMKLICYSEVCPYKRRFLCLNCLLQEKKDMENVVSLQDFLKDPISILDKRQEYSQLKRHFCQQLLVQIEDFENKLKQVQSNVQLQIVKLKLQVQSIVESFQQEQDTLMQKLKFLEFQQQLTLVWQMNSNQRHQEFINLENQLNKIIQTWKQYCEQAISVQSSSSNIAADLIVSIDEQLNEERNLFENLVKSLSFFINPQTDIPQFVLNQIKQGKLIKCALIYQGTRDGLMPEKYCEKCDKQSHLLTIITLKNGNTFGSYSPCQLNQDLTNYIADHTGSSFIFQQNKKEIYKLKNYEQAIYCRKDHGPICGSNDFYTNDMIQIYSSLGNSYDITGYNIPNKNTHLIGERGTQITECKVYKIEFL